MSESLLRKHLVNAIERIERKPDKPCSIAFVDELWKPMGQMVYVPAGLDVQDWLTAQHARYVERHRIYEERRAHE